MKKDLFNRWCGLFTVGVFLLLFAAGSVSLHAQQTGSLTGTILDPKGIALPNAAVLVKNDSTGATVKLTADSAGHFVTAGLTPGKYTIEASAPGFASTIKRGVQLTADRSQDLPLTLSIAAAADQVTVEAANANSIDQHNVAGVNPATASQKFTPSGTDVLTLLPGRSVMLAVTFGIAPRR
jgi:iron complex outermembrane receptor protein